MNTTFILSAIPFIAHRQLSWGTRYAEKTLSKVGTETSVKIRGKMQKAEITKMPFVESRYYLCVRIETRLDPRALEISCI